MRTLLPDQPHDRRFELPGEAAGAEAGVERRREYESAPLEARRAPNPYFSHV